MSSIRELSCFRVHQINLSKGGVPKISVLEAVFTTNGLEGDRQRNLKAHGGPDRAVCLFSLELIEELQKEGHPIKPGSLGENITLTKVPWDIMKPGVVLAVGLQVQLEVTSYTAPCAHNARWFHNKDYERVSQGKHSGWSRVYAKVLRAGVVKTGDVVEIVA